MTVEDLRALDASELQTKLRETLKEQFLLKMQLSNSQTNKTHRLGELRKKIARINTIMNELKRG